MLNRLHQTRQFLLIALMAFTLLGVQVVQSSPLHDHAQHSVDCGLCHLQLGDAVVVRVQPGIPAGLLAAPVSDAFSQLYVSASPSPYQGRAPPRFFS